ESSPTSSGCDRPDHLASGSACPGYVDYQNPLDEHVGSPHRPPSARASSVTAPRAGACVRAGVERVPLSTMLRSSLSGQRWFPLLPGLPHAYARECAWECVRVLRSSPLGG